MKKLLLCSLLFFAGTPFLIAQGPAFWTWARQSQGSFYEDAYSCAADMQNNVYTVGYYANDTCIIGGDVLMNAGSADFFITKHDEFGNLLWTSAAVGSGDEYGMAVTCDQSGNAIAIGNFSSATITFGTYILTNSNPTTPDIFVVKYAANGTVQWARSYGGNDWDNAGAVIVEATTNNVYVTGAYYNSIMIVGTDTLPSRGNYDMFLMKLDANGLPLWARSAGGNLNDLGNAICQEYWSGAIYVSGGFASDTLAFPTDTLVNAFGTQPDIFTVKYDQNGNCIWARREGSIDNDHSVSISVDANDQVYVAGHYHSPYMVIGNDTLMNMGMGDAFLIVYDTSGNPLWSKTFGGMDNDFGHSITVAPGAVYYTGMFMSSSMMVGTTMLTNAMMGVEDIFIVAYDNLGNDLWAVRDGGTGRDYLNSIAFSPNYMNLYVAGSFGSSSLNLNFNVVTNTDPGGTGEALFGRLDLPMSISESSSENSVIVFPNPGNGVFNFASATAITSVTVYNTLGEIVSTNSNINVLQFALDLSGENSGVYFYSIVTETGNVENGTLMKNE